MPALRNFYFYLKKGGESMENVFQKAHEQQL
jgi:hypothetical protein